MRIRIQPILIKYFEIIQKHPLNSIKKKNLNNYLSFSIQYYCPIVQTDQNSQFYFYALSLFAGSGSMRIRIHNTAWFFMIFNFFKSFEVSVGSGSAQNDLLDPDPQPSDKFRNIVLWSSPILRPWLWVSPFYLLQIRKLP